ncbi:hypothetical protein [Halapricum sp. CBA1109]|uniref:hypothetical protein n=1 Tax=Halapricum sp. CBA1109 TaxID=2668068 RepID=UPI0018D26DEA|nr:hypothetical protein [Halapricum sp. CBA1109]
MSHSGLSLDRIDVSLATLLVVGSVLALGLRLLATQVFLLVIPLAVGAGGGLYLLTQRGRAPDADSWRGATPTRTPLSLPGMVAGFLPAVTLAGLAGLVLATNAVGTRTGPIYLLVGSIGVAILAQILFVDDRRIAPGLVLAQILVAAVVIRLSALYATPGFVGIDIWSHATVYVDGIVASGSFVPLEGDKYLLAPLYHVVGAVGTLLVGGVRDGIYLTIGLVVPLSVLFVYATGRILLPARWALLASAFVAFSDQVIRWGMHLIPTSLGLVFFLAVLYALTRLFAGGADRWVVGLLGVASLAVVFTHQVSTVITLVVLAIAAAAGVVTTGTRFGTGVGTRATLSVTGVFVVTLGATLLSWSQTPFAGGRFLWSELAVLREVVAENAGFLNLASESPEAAESIGGPVTEGLVPAVLPYVELVGFALLLGAAVVGGIYMLRSEGASALSTTHLVAAAALFVLVFGLSLFGVRALLPGRWIAFLHVSLALLGAIGLFHLARTLPPRLTLAVFVLVAVGYPTTMVVAEKATLDAPAFDDQHKRFSFTESEIAAVETVSATAPADEQLGTDHPYVSLFRRAGGYGYDASILRLGTDGPTETDAAVYRQYQSTGPISFHRASESPLTELTPPVAASVCPSSYNSVYANDDVVVCTPPAAGGDA